MTNVLFIILCACLYMTNVLFIIHLCMLVYDECAPYSAAIIIESLREILLMRVVNGS